MLSIVGERASAGRWLELLPPSVLSDSPIIDSRAQLSMRLAATDLHVWMFLSPANGDLSSCWAILSAEERARAGRLVRTSDRVSFVYGHAMVRRILAAYEDIEATKIEFVAGEYGKPALPDANSVRCNWSHAGPVWLLAIARDGMVGVDVEQLNDDFEWQSVADIAFHQHERRFVEQTARDCLGRFYALWTRKEALLKGLGTGLHDDMAALTIVNASGVVCDEVLTPAGVAWRLIGLCSSPRFVAAVAADFAVARVISFAPAGEDLSLARQLPCAVPAPASSITARRPWIK